MEIAAATVDLLVSVPGLVHGFERPLVTAAPESRDETRRRVATALAPHGQLFLLQQVHGTRIVRAPWAGRPEADGGLASEPGALVGIETADCLPVLLVDPRRRVVAGAHAGWRGSAAGVTRRALEALAQGGTRPAEVRAALGPCIGPCCYEVGEEVAAAFAADASQVLRPGRGTRPHLDLQLANRLQLLAAGVPPDAIAAVAECTRCRSDLYHSYRRDGKSAGRMINYVGFERL